jgi:hypothetical protein
MIYRVQTKEINKERKECHSSRDKGKIHFLSKGNSYLCLENVNKDATRERIFALSSEIDSVRKRRQSTITASATVKCRDYDGGLFSMKAIISARVIVAFLECPRISKTVVARQVRSYSAHGQNDESRP